MSALLACAASLSISWTLLALVALPRRLRAILTALGTLAVFSLSGTVQLLWRLPEEVFDGVLLSAAVALAFLRRPQPRADPGSEAGAGWKVAFAATCAIALAALAEHLHRYPDGGADAFIIWNLRARWLFRAGGAFESAFSPEILLWTHQDYPLLLPGIVARLFQLAGRETDLAPAAVAVAFAACAVAVVVAALPARRRWLAGLALVTTPALVMLAATEQADVPLAAFVAAAVAILIVRQPGDLRAIAAAGAFASMAAWTKNEGLLHLLLIAAALLLDERRLAAGAAFLAGALPILVLLVSFKLQYAPPNDLLQATLAGALQRAARPERWGALALLSLRRIVLLQVWGLHLLAAIFYLAFTRKRTAPPEGSRWLSRFPCAFLFCCGVILLVQLHDPAYMFQVTVDRFLIQIWPAAVLLIFSRLRRVAA
jgi:hypothetical protein